MSLPPSILRTVISLSRCLFWPALLFVVWGELTPHPPVWTAHFWDKAQHFTAYFGLSGLAVMAVRDRRRDWFALLGLVLLGGLLEILQAFTGRDPDIFDALANTLGVATGAVMAGGVRWLFGRWGSRVRVGIVEKATSVQGVEEAAVD